jgi:hypothetical protein
MVWPWEVVYSIVDFRVWISCTFGAKLKNGPIFTMFVIEKLDQLVRWISICFLWPDRARSRGYDDKVCNVAKIEACFRVSRSGAGDNLPEYGSLAMDQLQYTQGIKSFITPFRPNFVNLGELRHRTTLARVCPRAPQIYISPDTTLFGYWSRAPSINSALFQLWESCEHI